MGRSLKMIPIIFLFLFFLCLLTDVNSLRILKENFKDSMDIATKAATLQYGIQDGNNFYIKDTEAKAAYLKVMALNMNCTEAKIKDCTVDYKAINNQVVYINPCNHQTFNINKPTFVAVVKVHFTGIIIKKDIVLINNFAGSELVNK